MICFLNKALACMTITNNHSATSRIVMMLATHWIAGLSSCSPIWISAIVKPTFGKTVAYHTHLKDICLTVWRVEKRAMQKNQKAKDQRKLFGLLVTVIVRLGISSFNTYMAISKASCFIISAIPGFAAKTP
jgi:uncharacterized membrane protein